MLPRRNVLYHVSSPDNQLKKIITIPLVDKEANMSNFVVNDSKYSVTPIYPCFSPVVLLLVVTS